MYKTKKTKHPKRPLAIDFDGVIHGYSKGFLDGSIYDRPIPETKNSLQRLSKDYFLYIYSSRSKTKTGRDAIAQYLKKYKIPYNKIVAYKPPAKFFIDDGAIHFKNWKQVLKDLAKFQKEFDRSKKI